MAGTPEKPRPPGARKKNPRAKNVSYSLALTEAICLRLARGESWFSICATRGMPSYSAFYVWRRRYPEFAEAVAIAREAAAELRADEALAVAQATTPATVTADRLRVSTLLGRAALDAPHDWGGKPAPAARSSETVEVVFRVRHFEKVVGPDGKAFVRELRPEGEAQDPEGEA